MGTRLICSIAIALASLFAGCTSSPGVERGARSGAASPDAQADWPAPVHDGQRFTSLRAEQVEYRSSDSGPDVARWEVQGWHGDDYNKLWVKAEGEQAVEKTSEGEVELQALYSRLVSPFWDLQAGVRHDRSWKPGADRWFGVVGVQGLAPYQIETELALFLSEDADVSARLTTTTNFLITQKLSLQPRFEAEAAVQRVPRFQVGQGLNSIDLGLRLRYEVDRRFTPYVGVNWKRSFGQTASLLRSDGGDPSDFAVVFGFSLQR